MNKRFLFLYLSIFLIFIISSCASSYKPINPKALVYDVKSTDGVGFGYRYDVLAFRGNNKYAKREFKKNIRLVAIKIENQSDKVMRLGENFNLYAGPNMIQPISPEILHMELKQGVAIYLLYSLIWYTQGECDEYGNCETTLILPVGIPISIGNMVVAGGANSQFKNELLMNNLLTKEINPGDTAYAIVGVSNSGFLPLSIQMK